MHVYTQPHQTQHRMTEIGISTSHIDDANQTKYSGYQMIPNRQAAPRRGEYTQDLGPVTVLQVDIYPA